jgi:hypothetical protein
MQHRYALLLLPLLLTRLAQAQVPPCTVAGQLTILSPGEYARVAPAGWPSGDGSWADTTGLLPPGITGTLVRVIDPGLDSLGAEPGTGCVPFTNAAEVAGNIALIRRGYCEFGRKALHAQEAGAIGWIVYNHREEEEGEYPVIMVGGEFGHLVTIPGLFAHWGLSITLRNALGAGEPVVVNLSYAECWVTAIEPQPDGSPSTHTLSAVVPNPSAGRSTFTLEVAATQRVRVAVYDALGREVAVLADGVLLAGLAHRLTFEGAALPAGLYVVRIEGEAFADARRLTLVH